MSILLKKIFNLLSIVILTALFDGCQKEIPVELAPREYEITFSYYIDANNKEDIELYLNKIYSTKESQIWRNIDGDKWSLVTEDGSIKSFGTMEMKSIDISDIPIAFKAFPPEHQVQGCGYWTYKEEGQRNKTFYAFLSEHTNQIVIYLYEDLSMLFQALYPEATIKSIIFRQKLKGIYRE